MKSQLRACIQITSGGISVSKGGKKVNNQEISPVVLWLSFFLLLYALAIK